MSLKVYISGKITGDPDYRGKFSTAESRLKAAGHIVLNPANSPAGMRPADYMRLCFAMYVHANSPAPCIMASSSSFPLHRQESGLRSSPAASIMKASISY